MTRVNVLPGQGTVVRAAGGVVVALPQVDPVLLRDVGRAVHGGGDGLQVMSLVARTVGSRSAGIGLMTPTSGGWGVLAGAGLAVRTDHVGYRSQHNGPVQVVVRNPVRLQLLPQSTPLTAPLAGVPLADGVGTGGGAVAITADVIGVAAPEAVGIACVCGVFVHPLAVRCPACSRVIGPERVPIRQPPVPVATLVLDDGRVFALEGDVVVGRDPTQDRRVAEGRAAPLTLPDTQRSVSRVHAAFTLSGWDVILQDLGAANGTTVRPPGAPAAVVLQPHSPIRVLPGTQIMLGRRTLKLMS